MHSFSAVLVERIEKVASNHPTLFWDKDRQLHDFFSYAKPKSSDWDVSLSDYQLACTVHMFSVRVTEYRNRLGWQLYRQRFIKYFEKESDNG